MKRNIDRLRKKSGLTVQGLAEKAGISLGYLNEIRSGKKRLNTDIIARLSKVLECKPSDIIDEDINHSSQASASIHITLTEKTELKVMGECLSIIERIGKEIELKQSNKVEDAFKLYQCAKRIIAERLAEEDV